MRLHDNIKIYHGVMCITWIETVRDNFEWGVFCYYVGRSDSIPKELLNLVSIFVVSYS